MQFPIEFIFLRPWWLMLLLLGPLLAFAVTRRGADSWASVCEASLLRQLTMGGSKSSVILIRLIIVATWTLAVFALAGPAWDREKAKFFENLDATVVVLDLSQSMNSNDLLPSRLERARYKSIELIENHDNRATGLVVFAGSAFDVVPVSDDVATLTHLIQSLQTTMMPVQGSRASLGIERARQLLERSGYDTGSVVLITDGVDPTAFETVSNLREAGYSLSVIAVGTESGAPIIAPNGEFVKDSTGAPVVVGVDYSELSRLAAAGGGKFSKVTEDVSLITAQWSQFAVDDTLEGDSTSSALWKDRGPYILLLLMPLAALLYRRGWLLVVAVFLVLPSQPSFAFEWSDLWQRPDQRAAEAVRTERFDEPVLSRLPRWNGIALYRKNEFDRAVDEFSVSNDEVSMFNKGNALAKTGNFAAAVEEYEGALQIAPEFEDAKFNLDIVRRLLKQQQMSDESEETDNRNQADSQQVETKDSASDDVAARKDQSDGQERQDEGDLSRRTGQQALGGEDPEEDEMISDQDDLKEQIALQTDLNDELDQVMEQWLRKIPDDPGGLLRRKFHYEYLLRGKAHAEGEPW